MLFIFTAKESVLITIKLKTLILAFLGNIFVANIEDKRINNNCNLDKAPFVRNYHQRMSLATVFKTINQPNLFLTSRTNRNITFGK